MLKQVFGSSSPRERLVHHVQELERLDERRRAAAANFKDALEVAGAEGYDRATLKVVLKLRKMTASQRSERRALEAIYMAALGMLEGEALPEEARRRLDGDAPSERGTDAKREPDESTKDTPEEPREQPAPAAQPPAQPPLIVKDPEEARAEGVAAAAAGKRIYDNPYPAGDPCRAAWDEGWCGQQKSHGMETPAAYQRRNAPPAEKSDKQDKRDGDAGGDVEKGAA